MGADDYNLVGLRPTCDLGYEVAAGFSVGLEVLPGDFVAGPGQGGFDEVGGGSELRMVEDVSLADVGGKLLDVAAEFVPQGELRIGEGRQGAGIRFSGHFYHCEIGARIRQGKHRGQDGESEHGPASDNPYGEFSFASCAGGSRVLSRFVVRRRFLFSVKHRLIIGKRAAGSRV